MRSWRRSRRDQIERCENDYRYMHSHLTKLLFGSIVKLHTFASSVAPFDDDFESPWGHHIALLRPLYMQQCYYAYPIAL